MSDSRPFTHAAFQQYLNEKQLMASYCPASDALYLPPRAICPQTHSDVMEWRALSGKGTLAAFTSVYVGPTAMTEQGYDRNNPYCAGIVTLDEGVKVSALILGVDAAHPETITIGVPVEVAFVETGEGDHKHMMLAFKVV